MTQETLETRGAKSLLPLHLADDALGLTDEHFWTWTEKLFTALKSSLGFVEQPRSYQPTLQISFSDDALSGADIYIPQFSKRATNFRGQLNLSAIHKVLISKAVNLTPHSNRTCLHVEVDISEYPELKYDIGDHMGIWPENPKDEVDALRSALGLDRESMHKRLSISSKLADTDVPHVYSNPSTLHALFSRHLGICNPISRKAALDLDQFAPSAEVSTKIRSITSDHETFARHKASYKITLAAMLSWASPGKPWNIPLSFVLEILPPIEPRYYSIASAPIVSPRKVSLCISLLSIPLQGAERVHGVASSNLRGIHDSIHTANGEMKPTLPQLPGISPAPRIFCHLRKSKFKPPVSSPQPMIMIATGTGIAPFRAFLQHRVRLRKMGKEIGKMMLFFGCRNDAEHLYKEELSAFQQSLHDRLEVIVAYSRSQSDKCYVQDKIREHEQDLVHLIVELKAKDVRLWLHRDGQRRKDSHRRRASRDKDLVFGRLSRISANAEQNQSVARGCLGARSCC